MKRLLLLIIICLAGLVSFSQIKSFRFAFISDTHIGSPNGSAEEDLRRTVRDINRMNDIAFVVITGDITEMGTNAELALAKQILDSLDVPYYIIPGNHDTGWSESGGTGFTNTFKNDKFEFTHNGILFIGCASGPYVRMSDGHVPRDAVLWMEKVLNKTPKDKPVIFLNHYPLDNGLDNWYEIIGMLKKNNTILALCGHGHANRKMDFEDIPGVMGRSNLRARQAVGGYNLVDITPDSAIFHERRPEVETLVPWVRIKLEKKQYATNKPFPRPDYSMNQQFAFVDREWTFSSDANVISTPAVSGDLVVFGNHQGRVDALSINNGKVRWSFRTAGSVFSSPAVNHPLPAAHNPSATIRRTSPPDRIVFGSTDGNVYCLNGKNGKLIWKFATGAAVLGSPLIDSNVVYIGGSDHHIRAIDLNSGRQLWAFDGLKGPVVSKPLLYEDKLILGAWDTYLYALDKKTGSLIWKWTNGSAVRNLSPASCTPVAHNGVVYIVAPDRYLTAIDANSGSTLWRTNQSTVRESIGLSANGELIFAKTMNDTVVAFRTGRELQPAAWKLNAGYGYDHVPSMLVERDGEVFFGTRSGVVYCVDSRTPKVLWSHKLDNSMVNTVRVLNNRQVLVSTMDGKVSLLRVNLPATASNKP